MELPVSNACLAMYQIRKAFVHLVYQTAITAEIQLHANPATVASSSTIALARLVQNLAVNVQEIAQLVQPVPLIHIFT